MYAVASQSSNPLDVSQVFPVFWNLILNVPVGIGTVGVIDALGAVGVVLSKLADCHAVLERVNLTLLQLLQFFCDSPLLPDWVPTLGARRLALAALFVILGELTTHEVHP